MKAQDILTIIEPFVKASNELLRTHLTISVHDTIDCLTIRANDRRFSGVFIKDLALLALTYDWAFSINVDNTDNTLYILL